MNKKIICPYCGDTWKYELLIDHENGKSLVTSDFHVIEEWEECTCYKCGGKYHLLIDSKPDMYMYPAIYKAWRTVGK